MAISETAKAHLLRLQEDALDILGELQDLMPPSYRLTLLARNCDGDEDTDIVLTNDVVYDAIQALERNQQKMEETQ